MSALLIIHCDGCGASESLGTGRLRGNRTRRGWTMTRGVASGGRRLRLDWCPPCTRDRVKARRLLRGRR